MVYFVASCMTPTLPHHPEQSKLTLHGKSLLFIPRIYELNIVSSKTYDPNSKKNITNTKEENLLE